MSKVAMVLPSCRRDCLDKFLELWSPFPWDHTIVCWDGVDKPQVGHNVDVYTWEDFTKMEDFGERGRIQIFSRKQSAIRSFGFLKAAEGKADVITTLDDDCYPENGLRERFVEKHFEILSGVIPVAASTVPGIHVRGMPFENITQHSCVGVNMGLWLNNADVDAVHALLKAPGSEPGFMPPRGTRVMSPAQLFSLCGMNFAFTRDMLPMMFFPRNGEGSKYSRYDDIWAGLVVQKALSSLGVGITVGEPCVVHNRASDPYKNILAESSGVALNEWLWKAFSKMEVSGSTPTRCVRSIADNLWLLSDLSPDTEYLAQWSQHLKLWLELCSAVK